MHQRIYTIAPSERATTPPEAASLSPESFLNQWVGVEEVVFFPLHHKEKPHESLHGLGKRELRLAIKQVLHHKHVP
ncbi:hypothetical protein L1987_67962 [Smallanthus sonchifolius]|uniref:Uncharacterized protein n=1 Tax=Smallanthus sonchifolius TaxID=185202 RepID=A0ACB9B3Y5_9ASTR|nr:hypothetical protein L1987_67962 [Smallanthus sonchifolius]